MGVSISDTKPQPPPSLSLSRLARAPAQVDDASGEIAARASPAREPPPLCARSVVVWEGEGEYDCIVSRDPLTGTFNVTSASFAGAFPFGANEDEWRLAGSDA